MDTNKNIITIIIINWIWAKLNGKFERMRWRESWLPFVFIYAQNIFIIDVFSRKWHKSLFKFIICDLMQIYTRIRSHHYLVICIVLTEIRFFNLKRKKQQQRNKQTKYWARTRPWTYNEKALSIPDQMLFVMTNKNWFPPWLHFAGRKCYFYFCVWVCFCFHF